MKRLLVTVLIALTFSGVTTAQGPRVRSLGARGIGTSSGGGGGGGGGTSTTLGQSDFTYLGAFTAPETIVTSWGDNLQPYYGEGLALKYESGDSNNLHFMAFGFGAPNSVDCPNCDRYIIYQMRVPAFSNPASPLNLNSYTTASLTGSATYPNSILSNKRFIYYPDFSAAATPVGPINNGSLNLYYDAGTDRTYTLYNYGYTGDCTQPSIVYSKLNYSSPASSTTSGPWTFNGVAHKATSGFMFPLTSSFIAAHTSALSGKAFAVGSGSPYSIVGACDASLGPSAIAFTPPADGATEVTALSNTPMVGYYPWNAAPGTGRDRANRGRSLVMPSAIDFDNAWGGAKFSQQDYVRGGVMIDTGTKTGVLFAARMGEGQCNYNSSYLACDYYRDWFFIYDVADFGRVVDGTATRYSIQPIAQWEVTWPFVDYTQPPNVNAASVVVSSITATAGSQINGTSGALPIVTTATAHGLSVGQYASIQGTSSSADYDAIWLVAAVNDATHFTIVDTSILGQTWTGHSATGGTMRKAASHDMNSNKMDAIAYDSTTKKLYVALSTFNNSGQAKYFVAGFQLP